MIAAIENLTRHAEERKIAIVGDMLELGDQTEAKHLETLDKLKNLDIEAIAVGEAFGELADRYPSFRFLPSTEAAMAYLKGAPIRGSLVLLKGSRKMKLEQLLELL